jgi:hypothetical protein
MRQAGQHSRPRDLREFAISRLRALFPNMQSVRELTAELKPVAVATRGPGVPFAAALFRQRSTGRVADISGMRMQSIRSCRRRLAQVLLDWTVCEHERPFHPARRAVAVRQDREHEHHVRSARRRDHATGSDRRVRRRPEAASISLDKRPCTWEKPAAIPCLLGAPPPRGRNSSGQKVELVPQVQGEK